MRPAVEWAAAQAAGEYRAPSLDTEGFIRCSTAVQVVPIPLEHAHFNVLGFRIDDVAYCTDVNEIPDKLIEL